MKKISFNTTAFNHVFASDAIVSPKRDWKILLTFFACLLFCALLFDVITYQEIATGSMYISVNENSIPLETLQTSKIESIIGNFQLKETQSATLKPGHSVDPSL